MAKCFVIREKNSRRTKKEWKHEIFYDPRGHRVIRGHCDLLYDPQGHDDLYGLFDPVYDPKMSRGH